MNDDSASSADQLNQSRSADIHDPVDGDAVGRDKIVLDNSIKVGDISNATVAIGHGASVTIINRPSPAEDLAPLIRYSRALEHRLWPIVRHYVPLPLADQPRPKALALTELANETPEQLDERCPTQYLLHREPDVLVVANGGAGKTMALQRLAWRTAREFSRNPVGQICPIFVLLHEYDGDLLRLIARTLHLDDSRTPIQEYLLRLPSWLERANCRLILDGLNEVSDKLLPKLIVDLQNLIRAYSTIQYCLSSRPLQAPASQLGLRPITLAPLSRELIQEMVARLLEASPARGKLLAHLRINDASVWNQPSSTLRLAQLPLAVQMLSALAKAGIELPRSPSRLFEQFIALQLKDWEARASRRSRFSPEAKMDALANLAFHVIKEGTGMKLSFDQVAAFFGSVSGQHQVLDEVIESGLLRHNGDNLEWWHQGVRDFSAAHYLADLHSKGEDLQPYYSQIRWDDVMVLVVGIVSDPASLVRSIDLQQPYLAARCLWESMGGDAPEDLVIIVREQLLANYDKVWHATGDLTPISHLILPMLDQTGDHRVFALLGNLAETQTNWQDAQKWYERALGLVRGVDARILLLCKLGTVLRRQQLHVEAQRWLQEAESLGQSSGYRQQEGVLYYELGYIDQKEGRTLGAVRSYNRSYKAEVRKGDLNKALIEKAIVGALMRKCYRFESALALLRPCVEGFERFENVRWLNNALVDLAEVFVNLGQVAQARDYVSRAIEIDQKRAASTIAYANIKRIEGLILSAEDKWLDACEVLEESRAAMENLGAAEQIAETFHLLGRAYFFVGEIGKAKEMLQHATTAPPHELNHWGIARAFRELAMIYMEELDYRAAIQALVYSRVRFKALHSLETKTLLPLEDTLKRIVGADQFSLLSREFAQQL